MSFSSQIKKARKEMLSEADEYRKAVTIKLFNSVIQDTPVDTGRLRGNWQTSEGSAISTTTERTDQAAALQEVQKVVEASQPETQIHLTNNLPYAAAIEFGSSGQAPEGMVRKNVARIEQILREEKP